MQVGLSVATGIVHVMMSGLSKEMGAVKLYRDVDGSNHNKWLQRLELLSVKKVFFKCFLRFACQHYVMLDGSVNFLWIQ
jgi:hypothetical protein